MVAFVPTCLILSASLPFLVTTAQDVGDFAHKGPFYTMTYKVNEDKQVTFDLDVPQVRVTRNVLKLGPYPLRYAPIRRHSNTYRIDFDKSNITALDWCKRWETFFKNNGIIGVDEPYSPAAGDIQLCYLTVLMILPSYHGIPTDFQNRLHEFKRKGYAAVSGMFVYEKPEQTTLSFKVTFTVKSEDDVLIQIEFRGEVLYSRYKLSLHSSPLVDRDYAVTPFGSGLDTVQEFGTKVLRKWTLARWRPVDLELLLFATTKTIYTQFRGRQIALTRV
ncbi:hypothetical protein FOZ60_002867 [Perkinsus olseni]|uniref:Uncharacterized protein n=1 Tax=Perkinsus olseni TaxID=32597 RepID=A0A7J6NWZ0_PEROL|nr:hypothetical protein FOZ60_002867 [Perkinsus olseni]